MTQRIHLNLPWTGNADAGDQIEYFTSVKLVPFTKLDKKVLNVFLGGVI